MPTSNDELPEGWLRCSLGDVVDYGKTVKAEPSEIEENAWILELEDIEKDTSKLLERRTFAERQSKSTKNSFEAGDVLYGKLRPYLNKVIIADQPGYCTTEIIPLKPNEALDGRYLFYWLKHPVFLDYVGSVSHGLNMPRLGTDAGKAAPFILAPLAEQKRIVDKLVAVLGRVDACRTRLDRVPELLKRFRQSVLAAATSGQLTADWRSGRGSEGSGAEVVRRGAAIKHQLLQSDPALGKKKSTMQSEINRQYLFEIPETWAFTSWGKVSEWVTYGFTRPMPHAKSGVRLVTAKDVLNFDVRLLDANFTTRSAFDALSDKDRPRKGDLLLTKDGTIGRAALVRTDEPFCINQSVAVCWLRTTEMVKPYLEIVANAEFTQTFIRDKAQGMAIQHLSIIDFGQCPLPVPPPTEQKEIVRRVEALFAFADRIEDRLIKVRDQVEHLIPAILSKAFRGELVPQDPTDEPASALLERLFATRESEAARPKPKKVRPKRVMKSSPRDSIRDVILSMNKNKFSFAELREVGHVDYETLTEAVFRLLAEEKPILKQVFNTKAKRIQFHRSKA
jgi:type I restriction enzyme S subunit